MNLVTAAPERQKGQVMLLPPVHMLSHLAGIWQQPNELVTCSEESACFSQDERSSLSKTMTHHENTMKQIFTMKLWLGISSCI